MTANNMVEIIKEEERKARKAYKDAKKELGTAHELSKKYLTKWAALADLCEKLDIAV